MLYYYNDFNILIFIYFFIFKKNVKLYWLFNLEIFKYKNIYLNKK